MSEIFKAIYDNHFEVVKRIVEENPETVHAKIHNERTPLDEAIADGKNLEIIKFLFEKGGRPNLEHYIDGMCTPVHFAVYSGQTKIFKWIFAEGVLPLSVLQIKDGHKWTPLDWAIGWKKLDIAKFLFEKGGRPNLDNLYCDEKNTPVHNAAWWGYTETLNWVFAEGILPLSVLNIKDGNGWTPLDIVIFLKRWKTTALFRCLIHLDPVFLAMQRAKRDYQCVLRRLPDELLDMVVDEVAARFHLKVVWH